MLFDYIIFHSYSLCKTTYRLLSHKKIRLFSMIFSSPEPKAPVNYCHNAPSGVRPSGETFHILDFFSRTAKWILKKLWGLMKYSWSLTSVAVFPLDRADPGGAKIGQGSPSSSDLKASAINRMHSDDQEACGKKCWYFFVPF